MKIEDLSETEAKILLRWHVMHDAGYHSFKTIKSLMNKGYLVDVEGHLRVTDKGIAFCDRHHMNISLQAGPYFVTA